MGSERGRFTSHSLLLLLSNLPGTVAGFLACRGRFWQRRGGARWSETVAGMLTEKERERATPLVLERESELTERDERRGTVASDSMQFAGEDRYDSWWSEL